MDRNIAFAVHFFFFEKNNYYFSICCEKNLDIKNINIIFVM